MPGSVVRVAALGYDRFRQCSSSSSSSALDRVLEIEADGGDGTDQAACSATATLLAARDGRVYAWGKGLGGELLGSIASNDSSSNSHCNGSAHADPVLLPLSPPLGPGPARVLALACGPHHVFMAVAGLGVWAWGLDVNGQTLGLGACGGRGCLACAGLEGQEPTMAAAAPSAGVVTAPRQVAGLEGVDIETIAAGEGHALALAADGRSVWAWGCGSSGQLGVGRPKREEEPEEDRAVGSCRPLPLDLSNLGPPPTTSGATIVVEQVAVGKRHSLMLAQSGQVYSWGSGLYHALGHGRTEDEWAPQLVAALEGIGGMAAMTAGGWHSLALSRGGDVYGWGWNRNGQLGRGGSSDADDGGGGAAATLVPMPRLLRVGEKEDEDEDVEFAQIGAGVHYSAALAPNGRLYAWGALGLAAHDPSTAAAEQPSSSSLWDVAGPLQQQQQQQAASTMRLTCGPYHLAVVASGAPQGD